MHHDDLFGAESCVPSSALQQWAASDERVYKGVVAVVEKMVQLSVDIINTHSYPPSCRATLTIVERYV